MNQTGVPEIPDGGVYVSNVSTGQVTAEALVSFYAMGPLINVLVHLMNCPSVCAFPSAPVQT